MIGYHYYWLLEKERESVVLTKYWHGEDCWPWCGNGWAIEAKERIGDKSVAVVSVQFVRIRMPGSEPMQLAA
jgi:hypothetical protein